jgi:hypothetical protein
MEPQHYRVGISERIVRLHRPRSPSHIQRVITLPRMRRSILLLVFGLSRVAAQDLGVPTSWRVCS